MRIALASIAILFLFFSCKDTDKNGKLLDTPTSGATTIAADESLRPLVEAEVEVFNSMHLKLM